MKDNELEAKTLMVDLDSLFDTRLGTILKMGVDPYLKVIKDNYHSRLNDEFSVIDLERYKELYKARDVETLKHSQVTPVIDFIRSFVFEVVDESIHSPNKFKPKVLLNAYPYTGLSKEEEVELISMLVNLTGEMADVELCYRDLTKLHPVYLKSNIAVYIRYDYVNWLEHYICDKTLTDKVSCPEVAMLGPAIAFNDIEEREIGEAVSSMEQLMAMFIGLNLMDVEMFSSKVKYEDLERVARAQPQQE